MVTSKGQMFYVIFVSEYRDGLSVSAFGRSIIASSFAVSDFHLGAAYNFLDAV